MPRVGDVQQPQGQWKIDKHIRNKSQRRSQHQHEHGPDRRSEKYPELPAGGVEPNGALKMLHANNVVNQQLLGRRPHHAGDTVNNQEKRRMPDLNRIGEKSMAQTAETLMNRIWAHWTTFRQSYRSASPPK